MNDELIVAANSAIALIDAMSDEAFIAALEECDDTIAYAIDPNFSRTFEPGLADSITATGRRIMANLINDK